MARLDIACWIGYAFLSLPSFRPTDDLLAALGWFGRALRLLGFLIWRKESSRAEPTLPLRAQIYPFASPLVGFLLLVGGVILAGASIAGDHASFTDLALVVLFIVVGAGLVHGSQGPARPAELHSPA